MTTIIEFARAAGLTLSLIAALGVTPGRAGSDEPARGADHHAAEWGPHDEYGEYLAAPEELAGVPVNDIANATGFRSASQFNRAFKEFVGVTPSTCRRTSIGS